MIKEVVLPEISETVESGDVIELFVRVGDMIDVEQPLVQLETEKATFDVPSPVKGKVVEIVIKPGQSVNIGQLLLKVDTDAKGGEKQEEDTASQEPQQEKSKPIKSDGENSVVSNKEVETVPATPSVPAQPEEPEPNETQIAGTVSDDRPAEGDSTAQPVGPTADKPLPDFSAWGQIERKAVTTTRRKIAQTLSYTWSSVPQVTQYGNADITVLEQFQKYFAPQAKDAGGKLTLTAIALKAVAMAVQEFPDFNASFDAQQNEIVYKKYCHLSVAVDTDRGLLVPVLRDVDKKNLLQIAAELTTLAERTRQRKVTPEEMVGGNFTVSNLGGLGGGPFAPIIHWPQTAILGIARAARQPVYIGDTLQPRLIAPLSLSYDHRIIDGAHAVRFLRRIIDILENPFSLMM